MSNVEEASHNNTGGADIYSNFRNDPVSVEAAIVHPSSDHFCNFFDSLSGQY
jgi:hypothetical protein